MFTQNTCMYVKHGKIYLATEYSREDTEGPEPNPYQLVASICKPLSPIITSVTTYSSCSVQASILGFPGGSVVKNLPGNAGDVGSIPGSGRSPGEGNGNPLQYSCLENSMNGGAWWATGHGIAKQHNHEAKQQQQVY